MREFLIILGVIVVLLGLTAFRYRRQIRGLIEVSRMLRDAKDQAVELGRRSPEKQPAGSLVKCDTCGILVPSDRTLNLKGKLVCDRCSDK